MKTLLAIAIGAVLLTACGGSDSDDPNTDTATGTETDTNTSTGTDTGTDSGTGSGTGTNTGTNTGTDTNTGTTSPATPLDDISDDLVVSLAAYGADDAVRRVRELSGVATGSALGSRSLSGTEVALFEAEGSPTATSTVTEYDCALGGTFVRETVAVDSGPGDSGSALDSEAFRFDQCRLEGDGGESVADGALTIESRSAYGSRADSSSREQRFADLAISEAGGRGLEIDGTTTASADNDTARIARSRTIALSRYVETTGDTLVERLDDASLALSFVSRGDGLFDGYSLEASGTVTGETTGGAAVTIDTVTPFRRDRRTDGFPEDDTIEPFVGELSFRADDGRTLTTTARDTDTAELFVDRTYVTADGTTRTTENVPFAVLTAPTPNEIATMVDID